MNPPRGFNATERNIRIVELWKQDYTSGEIAAMEGCTRNSVIGVVNRAKQHGLLPLYRNEASHAAKRGADKMERARIAIAERERQRKEKEERMAKLQAEAEARLAKRQQREADTAAADTAVSGGAGGTYFGKITDLSADIFKPDPPDLGGVSLFNLQYGQCKWVLPQKTQNRMSVYCGKTVVAGESWCPHHRKLCTTTPYTPRRDSHYGFSANVPKES